MGEPESPLFSGIGLGVEPLEREACEFLRAEVVGAWLRGGWPAVPEVTRWRVPFETVREWLRAAGYDPWEPPDPVVIVEAKTERAVAETALRIAQEIQTASMVEPAGDLVDATRTLKNLTLVGNGIRNDRRQERLMRAQVAALPGLPGIVDARSAVIDATARDRLESGRRLALELEAREKEEEE